MIGQTGPIAEKFDRHWPKKPKIWPLAQFTAIASRGISIRPNSAIKLFELLIETTQDRQLYKLAAHCKILAQKSDKSVGKIWHMFLKIKIKLPD
jgi:hypothetical protein